MRDGDKSTHSFAQTDAAVCTFVAAGDAVRRGEPETLGGVHGAGRSVRQFRGGGRRNVVVHESVPVELHVHHLGGRRVVIETPRAEELSSFQTYSFGSQCLQSSVRSVQLWDADKWVAGLLWVLGYRGYHQLKSV